MVRGIMYPFTPSRRGGFLTVIGALMAGSAFAQPAIDNVSVNNLPAGPQLTINGSGFGTVTPSVTVDSFGFAISSFTQTVVVASAPPNVNLPPGTYTLTLTNNSTNGTKRSITFSLTLGAVGPAGPTGATGPAGPSGATGPAGPAGATGPAGTAGPAGPVGSTGPAGAVGPAGATGAVGPAGPAGATGPAGAIGPAGATGAIGPAGPAGSTGAAGPAGPQGLPGATGQTGATGPQGPAGTTGPTWFSTALSGPLSSTWTAGRIVPDQDIAVKRVTVNLKNAGLCGPATVRVSNGAAGQDVFLNVGVSSVDSGPENIVFTAGTPVSVSVTRAASCGTNSPADANVLVQYAPSTGGQSSCSASNSSCSGICTDPQSDPGNCGTCGNTCGAVANASGACQAGACGVGSCNAGFGNCNGIASDGCETSLNADPNNCGACGTTCSFANASGACSAGACHIGACNGGFGDCNLNGADGCETNLTANVNNCGACGNVCSFNNAVGACSAGACHIGSCNAGFGDCNLNGADGCETNLTANVNNCGTCGNVCSFANASGACSAGACHIGSCNSGFGDCNSNGADGCETNLTNNVTNCGACGNVCSFNHAVGACAAGACMIGSCNAGFGNCDSNPANGCEVNLQTDTNNCGACGHVCGGTQTCSAGACI